MDEIASPNELQPFFFKSIDETVKLIFKNLVLINGGAAIAILAFAGNILSRPDGSAAAKVAGLAPALSDFSWGVGLAVAAVIASYASGVLGAIVFAKTKSPSGMGRTTPTF